MKKNMVKKLGVTLMSVSLMAMLVGCNTDDSEKEVIENDNPSVEVGKEETPVKDDTPTKEDVAVNDSVVLSDVLTGIKEKMNDEFIKSGATDMYEDGKLLYYEEVNLTESDDLSPIFLERLGIDSESLAEGFVISPQMNVKSDEIILLKAKDETKVDELKAALENELASQKQTWEMYLPDQLEKVEKTKIIVKDNYLLYVTFDNTDSIVDVFNESVK